MRSQLGAPRSANADTADDAAAFDAASDGEDEAPAARGAPRLRCVAAFVALGSFVHCC